MHVYMYNNRKETFALRTPIIEKIVSCYNVFPVIHSQSLLWFKQVRYSIERLFARIFLIVAIFTHSP